MVGGKPSAGVKEQPTDRGGPAERLENFARARRRRALFVVENLPVPFDRRVAQEAVALRDVGFDVSVISPQGDGEDSAAYERWEGIDVHRFSLEASTGGAAAYAHEYATASYRVARLIRKLTRHAPFDVIHIANPPDLLFAAVRLAAGRSGARLIFDQHDLFTDLLEWRAQRLPGAQQVARAFERYALNRAETVVVPNDSYRAVAMERGRRRAEDVFVVRNAPDLRRFRRLDRDPSLGRGQPHVIAYLGVMGPQDGIDHALRALAALAASRDDWHAIFMGDGMVLPSMRQLAAELGIAERVEFTGNVGDDVITRVLSSADVGLAPDPSNPFNDRSTMNKILEYMALGVPTVAYDLPEARVSAADAGVYATKNEPTALAACISALLDDPERRRRMGATGEARIAGELSWDRSRDALYAAYCRTLGVA